MSSKYMNQLMLGACIKRGNKTNHLYTPHLFPVKICLISRISCSFSQLWHSLYASLSVWDKISFRSFTIQVCATLTHKLGTGSPLLIQSCDRPPWPRLSSPTLLIRQSAPLSTPYSHPSARQWRASLGRPLPPSPWPPRGWQPSAGLSPPPSLHCSNSHQACT